jgi:hypothetical protein
MSRNGKKYMRFNDRRELMFKKKFYLKSPEK